MNGDALIVLMLVTAGISAALVDEVTSILFMSTAMLNITSRYKLNPIPFIIMVVFATNIGSSATAGTRFFASLIWLGSFKARTVSTCRLVNIGKQPGTVQIKLVKCTRKNQALKRLAVHDSQIDRNQLGFCRFPKRPSAFHTKGSYCSF